MAVSGFDLDTYLQRIGVTGPVSVDAHWLECIQRGQLQHIAFENFDVLLGRDISLQVDALVHKLVRCRRGGYCFELNGLLGVALQACGYRLRSCLARVIYGRGSPGPRTHQVLIVEADGREWLVDAGFGGPGLRAPLPLDDREHVQDGDRFRTRRDDEFGPILQKRIGELWSDLYAIDLAPALQQDFEMAHFFMSRHPQSYFRLHRVASLQRDIGRVALLDLTLNVERHAASNACTLEPGPGYIEALAHHFGIELDARYEDLPVLANQRA